MSELASPDRPDFADNACGRLRHAMAEADGAWHPHHELEQVGGRRFPARLHDIERGSDGGVSLAYECRAIDGREGAYEYRLRPWREDEERPTLRRQRARERIEELLKQVERQAEEIARLTRRLEEAERRSLTPREETRSTTPQLTLGGIP
jgi:predicted RNase H-like nuclease (RuvC/YqgF family)